MKLPSPSQRQQRQQQRWRQLTSIGEFFHFIIIFLFFGFIKATAARNSKIKDKKGEDESRGNIVVPVSSASFPFLKLRFAPTCHFVSVRVCVDN